MTNKTFKLYKAGLLWLAAALLNVAVGVGGVYAAAPTADDLVRSAQDYLDGAADSGFLRELYKIVSLEDEGLRRSIHDSLKGKLIALRSKDGTGNTLAHKIISDRYLGIFVGLFHVEGIAVLEAKNDSGQLPLSTLPADEKVRVLLDLSRSADGDEGFSEEFSSYLKEHELTPLKRQVTVLVKEIDALKLRFHEEIKDFDSEQSRELEDKECLLRRIINLSPSVLEGQKLENFEGFFDRLNQTPEDRAVLRGYRIDGRKSLLQYYVEKISSIEGDWWVPQRHLQTILVAYFEDSAPITHRDWDITEFDSSLQDLIVQTLGAESAKQFFLTYQNSKGENLVQVVARRISSSWELRKVRDVIRDDPEFLKLLTVAAPRTESAENMLMKTLDGQQFLTELDPKYWVKAGPYGVTPLMMKTLEGYDEAFETLLADLKSRGIRVDQRDSFGNTVQSIRAIVASERYYAIDVLLDKSIKSRRLQDSLWDEILNFPYRPVVQESHRFIDSAFGLVRSQPQTPLHRAFFQENVRDQRKEANALWRSFFKTYDGLVDKEIEREQQSIASGWGGDPAALERRQLWVEEERDLPLAARYLNVVSRGAAEVPPEHANMIANVLVGHSTFGINFSRKVTHPEAQIVVRNIRAVVKSLEKGFEEEIKEKMDEFQNPDTILRIVNGDFSLSLTAADMGKPETAQLLLGKIRQKLKMPTASENDLFGAYFSSKIDLRGVIEGAIRKIKSAFFQDYLFPLEAEKTHKLLNHRLNCAVVALFDFFAEGNKGQDGQMMTQMLGIPSGEGVFDFIDQQLQDKVPAGTIVNSRARFERLQVRYPDAFESGF